MTTPRPRSPRLFAPQRTRVIPPRRRVETPVLALRTVSMLTCPVCGHEASEMMPTDSCQYFYECAGMQNPAEAEGGRLLRVLFLRGRAVPADSGSAGERQR